MLVMSGISEFGGLMKVLGYPRIISVESFRSPNFELVADCLHWLILRYKKITKTSKYFQERSLEKFCVHSYPH